MYKCYPNVILGKNVIIEDYAIIGKPPAGTQEGELKTVIGDNAVIRSHTVIYAGNVIGNNFQTGHHVTVREHNTIGDDVSIGTSSVVEHHVKLANKVRLHSQVFVCEFSVVEEGAWLGPNSVLTNAKYPQYEGVKEHLTGVRICKKAKIGANTTLLPGVIIGENAMIGAGSVVSKNVPSHEVWVGNPAKKLKNADEVGYNI
jgi:acetyltransferase-like isoleucine patch superfamily enzyme